MTTTPPPAGDAPAACPTCERVLTPYHRPSDDTYRFPEHPVANWLDQPEVEGHRCCESNDPVRPYDYRAAERAARAAGEQGAAA
ncbi:MAG TPA: hypothetical protein VHK88_20020 [Aquihabitans sp.]|jgi:hypothetical protein|nr:hypothetical protein [Aquihabitans sp.]